jgi:predicted dehydrogenase
MRFDLVQAWPAPSAPLPIVIIGAGGIVENAHLPAYRKLGFTVRGLYDRDPAQSRARAERFAIETVYGSLAEAAAEPGVIFDIAVPARAVLSVLAALPEGSSVLIQKPMGETLDEARRIRELCEQRRIVAAVNFQLRFSPNMLALADAMRLGLLGDVVDVEVRVNTYTPWQLWPFLAGIPRHEILYHSVHYLDLVRSLLGEPKGVQSKVTRHPLLERYSDTRSATVLDYGEFARAVLTINHSHEFGDKHAMSELKVEGTKGAAVARMGVNLDYPRGTSDTLELCERGRRDWRSVSLRGSWFPEAFEGTMSNLQRFVAGEDSTLLTAVGDAYRTMALVEACYQSSATKTTNIPE